LRLRALVVAPIPLTGRPHGTLTLVTRARRCDDGDVANATELGIRIGLSLERTRLYQSLQATLAHRDEILRVVSHDLGNSLMAVGLHAQALLRLDASAVPRLQRHAESVERGVAAATRLVQDLADLADLTAGRRSLHRAPVAALPLAEEARATLEPAALARKLTLNIVTAPDLPPVACDRNRIAQVLANLVGSAIKLTPEGGSVRISITRSPRETIFSVRSSGPGVAVPDREQVLERHSRKEVSMQSGSGLGLFVARSIVEAHGGRISIDNEPGRDATFCFSLPDADATC
jgi:signal transduction histidine kinase